MEISKFSHTLKDVINDIAGFQPYNVISPKLDTLPMKCIINTFILTNNEHLRRYLICNHKDELGSHIPDIILAGRYNILYSKVLVRHYSKEIVNATINQITEDIVAMKSNNIPSRLCYYLPTEKSNLDKTTDFVITLAKRFTAELGYHNPNMHNGDIYRTYRKYVVIPLREYTGKLYRYVNYYDKDIHEEGKATINRHSQNVTNMMLAPYDNNFYILTNYMISLYPYIDLSIDLEVNILSTYLRNVTHIKNNPLYITHLPYSLYDSTISLLLHTLAIGYKYRINSVAKFAQKVFADKLYVIDNEFTHEEINNWITHWLNTNVTNRSLIDMIATNKDCAIDYTLTLNIIGETHGITECGTNEFTFTPNERHALLNEMHNIQEININHFNICIANPSITRKKVVFGTRTINLTTYHGHSLTLLHSIIRAPLTNVQLYEIHPVDPFPFTTPRPIPFTTNDVDTPPPHPTQKNEEWCTIS